MRGWFLLGSALMVGAGVALFLLSAPQPIDAATLPAHAGDPANGKLIYDIGGCISCHLPPAESGRDIALPSGGRALETPVGTFYPGNITPDAATGIGAWPDADFVNALQHGIGPDGRHYIPAFPYISYGRMRIEDVLDLKAYLMTLPSVAAEAPAAELPLAWVMRRGVGLWQRRARLGPVLEEPDKSAAWNRGAYLVNAPGHCAECHTPRDLFMTMDPDRAFAGGPHPEGKGKVPSLRGLIARGDYTGVDDIFSALKEGEEGGYYSISARGMAAVQQNIARLPDADIRAIAEYLAGLD